MFPGVKLEAGVHYFVRDCEDLTPSEQAEVKQRFAKVLDEDGICKRRGSKVCNFDNFGIICGRRVVRRRRSADGQVHSEEVSEAHLSLEVIASKSLNSSRDAERICATLKIQPSDCSVALAKAAYRRYLKAALLYGRMQMKNLFKNPESVSFKAAGRDFETDEDGLSVSAPFSECDEGMVLSNDMCCKQSVIFHLVCQLFFVYSILYTWNSIQWNFMYSM